MNDQETMQQLLDRAAITELIHCYATGADNRDWKLFRSIFTDEIEVWLGSVPAEEAPLKRVSADTFAERASRVLGRFAVTQHVLSNHRITVQGDKATCIVYLQARHFPRPEEADQKVWDIGGYYTHHLTRTAEGWKIARYTLTVTWSENTPPGFDL